ncbi:MAG: leucine-rich repeat protein [Bacteroidaceae bacterium]|nr:leucine-rich repeat protein [Bacteroidaceae bacterium]
MKKFTSLLLLLLLAITMSAQTTATVDGIKYILDGTNATVTFSSYPDITKPGSVSDNTYSGDVEIPSLIKVDGTDYNVTSIGKYAFRYARNMTSLSLPEGITTIDEEAIFKTYLTEITIPNSVNNTGKYALGQNSNLTKVTFGANVANNTGNKLGKWVCWRPSGAYDVYMLCDVKPVLPDNQTFDDTHASTIHVKPELYDAYKADPNWNIYDILDDVGVTLNDFTVDGIKYKMISASQVIVTYPNGSQPSSSNPSTYTGDITIPQQVTYGEKTYNVTGIGDYAFYNANITSLTLPEGITKIGYKTIYGTQITEITLPNSLTTMDYEALGYNTKLVTIRFGENIAARKWGDKLCYNPSGTGKKKEVYMNCNAVPKLQSYTFDYAGATIHVRPDVYDAFMADSKWNAYDIIGDIGLEDLSDFTVDGIKYKILSSKDAYVTYPNENEPSSSNVSTYSGDITIPQQVTYAGYTFNVTAIGDFAFYSAGITSLTLPEGITKLGQKSIYNTQITEITLPNSLTTMDYEALGYNKQLVTINFGENIATNTWGNKLCIYGGKKYEVYMNCNAVPKLQSYTFDFTGANVHVRPTMYRAFMDDAVWSTYDIIGDLWIEYTYDDLQAVITTYPAPTGDAVGTDPGCYTITSVQALNDAVTAAQALDNTATLEQLNNAINDIITAYDGLKINELQEGYYYIENVYKSGTALYGSQSSAATQGVKISTFDASNNRYYFKLTHHGGNWMMQNAYCKMYVGTAIGENENNKYISLTSDPVNEQIITWVDAGKYTIQSQFDATSTTAPYRSYSSAVTTYSYSASSSDLPRSYWRIHPAEPGRFTMDFNLENGRVRGFVHDFEYADGEASKISSYNTAPPSRRDQPVPATVFWTRNASSTAQHLTWSTNASFANATTVEVDNNNASYEIYNLIPGNKYYYKVTATVGGSETELINSTFTTSGQVRQIKADGVSNIRDLGGWATTSGKTISYGKIYRGAAFTSTTITQEGIDAVRAVGVKAELDLRDNSQDGSMSASLLGSDVEYNRIKLAQTASHMTGLTDSKNQYIACMQYVIDCVKNDKPVYFHCAIGRDRTGTLAFLLEGLLGMSKSDIYKDYELTNFSSLNTSCSKTQLDEMFTMIEGLDGATLTDKFYTYCHNELGLSAKDIMDFRSKMLGIVYNTDVDNVVAEAVSADATSLDLSDYSFVDPDELAAKMEAAESNLLVTVSPTSGITGTNIINDGVCSNLVITDGKPFSAPSDFTATEATYTRNMSNQWGTVCLPYAVSSSAAVKYYNITGVENGALVVSELATLPAGTPALVCKLTGDGITATATNAPISATINNTTGSVTMYGVFEQTQVNDASAYYIKDNKFWKCNNYFNCGAFRAYFTISGSTSPSFSILIGDDDPTAIGSVTADGDAANAAGIYGVDGKKYSTLQPGINIIKMSNGKTQKIIKK